MFHVYLAPVEAQPRLLAVREHLPQGNSEHPRVCCVGERPGLKTLWSTPEKSPCENKYKSLSSSKIKSAFLHPPCKGDLPVLLHDVVLVIVGQRPHQAKVPDLYFVG